MNAGYEEREMDQAIVGRERWEMELQRISRESERSVFFGSGSFEFPYA